MTERSNLDNFYNAQFNAVAKLFEENSAFESPCLRLLEDPQLPRYRRVTCHYMMAHIKENWRFRLEKGIQGIEEIEGFIKNGRVAERFRSWTVRARGNIETLRSNMEAAQADEGEKVEEENVADTKQNKAGAGDAKEEEEETR